MNLLSLSRHATGPIILKNFTKLLRETKDNDVKGKLLSRRRFLRGGFSESFLSNANKTGHLLMSN